ncbi:MAG: hypothetical protein AAF564_00490 [Bacteroidota bacterium]
MFKSLPKFEHFDFKIWRGSLVFLPICLYFLFTWGEYTLMDSVDLIIHEAGHFFFRFFGRFMMFLGGTLMQLIVPGILIFNFVVHDYRFGTQVSLFWLGHNLINISVYAADARARQLPLLGGNAVEHDWWTMLGMLNLLEYDQLIGNVFFGMAIVVFVILLILPKFMPY